MQLTPLFVCLALGASAQTLTGKVIEAKSKEPLPFANVVIPAKGAGVITSEAGEFKLDNINPEDSIEVSFVGFKTIKEKASNLRSPVVFSLREFTIVLNEVSVSTVKLNPNDLLKSMRVVRDNLYAANTETTNFEYNRFLHFSGGEQNGLKFDLSNYRDADKAYFQRYHADRKGTARQKRDSTANYSNYPAVNVSYDAAVAYCEWLTDEFNNSSGRKRYKKVKFRLPTLDEWRIAALGDAGFQTWKLEENFVMVSISKDTLIEMVDRKKKKEKIWAKDIWYPWFTSYHYHKKAQNHLNFFLGNFKEPMSYKPCITPKGYPKGFKCPPFGDGFARMSETGTYFPNDMGLYDVVGNVSEMIDERGKACGGSWDSYPTDATIWTVDTYTTASGTVGFRVFMEVVEK